MHLLHAIRACSGVVQQATCQIISSFCSQAGSVSARGSASDVNISADHARVSVKLQTHCWSMFLPTDLSTLRKVSQGRVVMRSSSMDMQSMLEMIW